MEARILVQRRSRTDPAEATYFAEKHSTAKFVLILSSLTEDEDAKEYFTTLSEKLKIPFISLKVSGFITPEEGYCEDSVAVVALCGDFSTQVFHELVDAQNMDNSSKDIQTNLKDHNLCITYWAGYMKNLNILDAIFRRIKKTNEKLKLFGSVSTPKPLTATNKGVFDDHLVYAAIKGLKFRTAVYSGFVLDPSQKEEYIITKSDEFKVYEINNKSAAEEYSRMQHMRPYFSNTVMNLLTKTGFASSGGTMAKTNKKLNEGIIKSCESIYGEKNDSGEIEPFTVYKINEEDGSLTCGNYKPVGTRIKRIYSSKESQLQVYEKIARKSAKDSFTLIDSCTYTGFWIDSDFDSLREKLRRLKHRYLIYFSHGGIGSNKGINLTHSCSTGTLHLN